MIADLTVRGSINYILPCSELQKLLGLHLVQPRDGPGKSELLLSSAQLHRCCSCSIRGCCNRSHPSINHEVAPESAACTAHTNPSASRCRSMTATAVSVQL